MRGQSPLISHSLVIGFSMFLILVVVITFNYLEDDYRSFAGRNEIRQLCGIIKYGAEKLYNPSDYVSPTNSTMGRVTLMLPNRIGGIIYRARFADDSVYVTTMADPVINTTCKLGFNASFSGSTDGGETEIIWITYPDRKDDVIMRMVSE